MHNFSILEILRTFTPEEVKKFEDFVSSPYFNKKSGVLNLYKHIKKYYPEFQSQRLKRENVWNVLYPEKTFNYGVFKNLIFNLAQLAEKFITIEYIKREYFKVNYTFLKCLNQKEIKNPFKSKFHSFKKNFDKAKKGKDIAFENYYELLSKIYLLKFNFSNKFDRHSEMEDEFNKYSIYRTSILLHSLFHTCNNALNFSWSYKYRKEQNIILTFVKKADSNHLISELLKSLKPASKEIYEIQSAYYKYYKSLSDNTSIEKYFDFKEALKANASSFPKPDRYHLYTGLQNSLAKLKPSEINQSQENLNITKIMIKDDVMFNPYGLIHEGRFSFEIQNACNLGDSDFIENFSNKFIKHLHKSVRENMKKFSSAHLYFTRNEFRKSLEQILKANCDWSRIKIYLTNLQMMNYYELNDYNSFLTCLDSYKHFIDKDKSLSENYRKTQTLFINFLNKQFKLKENFDEFQLKNLRNEITLSNAPKKQWLLRKVEELERKVEKV